MSCKNKMNEIIGKFRKHDVPFIIKEEKKRGPLFWILVIIGAVAVMAGIAFAVYKFVVPKYMNDFEDDLDEDDFFDDEEDFEEDFEDEEEVEVEPAKIEE